MNQPEQMPNPFAELLRKGAALNEDEKLAARHAFLQRVDAEPKASSLRQLRAWMAPMVLAATALLVAYTAWPSNKLGYEVSGASDEGGYIRTAQSGSARIEFSDETLVTAEAETRLRVVETQEHGARISLEQGSLHVAVTHEEQTAWQFVAGPFQVHVTGTRFDLEWDAEHEQLNVLLHEGSVNVEGYAGSGLVEVNAGQRFFGDARSRTMQVHDASSFPETAQASEPARAKPADQVDDVAESPEPSSSSKPQPSTTADSSIVRKPASPSTKQESWTSLVSRGDFKRVVAQANQRGISTCIASCGAQDLNALADASRYTGQTALAEKSLLALRSRFAASAGNRAAFLLGRLYEGQGKTGKALEWYHTALTQSPGGPFAPESLAGKMRTISAVQGKAAAAPIAREYLQRYPNGVHAAAARQLAQTP